MTEKTGLKTVEAAVELVRTDTDRDQKGAKRPDPTKQSTNATMEGPCLRLS